MKRREIWGAIAMLAVWCSGCSPFWSAKRPTQGEPIGPSVTEDIVDSDWNGKAEGVNAHFVVPVADTGAFIVTAHLLCADGKVWDRGVEVPVGEKRQVSWEVARQTMIISADGLGRVEFGFARLDQSDLGCGPPFRYELTIWRARGGDEESRMFDGRWSVPSRLRGDEKF